MSAPMAQLRTLPTSYSNYGSFSLHQAFIERLLKIKNRFLVKVLPADRFGSPATDGRLPGADLTSCELSGCVVVRSPGAPSFTDPD